MSKENFSSAGVIKYEISEQDLMAVITRLATDTANSVIAKFEEERTPEFITRKEAMEVLNVKTASTMISWEEKGYLNPHKICGRIFYRKDQIVQAFENFTRTSNALN